MAEEEKNEDAPTEEGGGKKKRSKLIIIIAAAVVVLLSGGGAAAFFLMGGSGDQEMAAKDGAESPSPDEGGGEEMAKENPEPDAEGEKKTEEKAKPKSAAEALMGGSQVDIDFGCTVTMKPFNLNLGNPLENRFIRLEVAVEYQCDDSTEQEINRRNPQLRDAVVAVVSRKTREFLLSPDGKDQLRLEILNRVNHYMSRNIDNVYITDILIE